MLSSLAKHKKEQIAFGFEKKICVDCPARSWSEYTGPYQVLGQWEENNICGKQATEMLM